MLNMGKAHWMEVQLQSQNFKQMFLP
jgi:hypothetical protein